MIGEQSLIFDGSRLGIGLTPSGIALDISRNTQGGIRITDTAVTDASYEIRTQTGNSTKMFRIYDVSAGDDKFQISSDGQVKVTETTNATSTTTGAFVVSGGIGVAKDVVVGGDMHVVHDGLAVNIFESNDNHSRLRIRSSDASLAQLEFADQTDADAGEIRYDHANDKMTFHVYDNTERLGITSEGRTFINTTAVTNTNDQLTVKRAASNFSEMSMTVDANTTTGTYANAFIFTKSKNTYWNGLGFQSSHGHIGAIVGMRDSTGMNASHKMRIEIGGTGINASEEKTWDFLNTGNLSISDGDLVVASGHGIDFSATADGHGTPSELLDDYEEGSFTATLSGSGWSYTNQYGFYRKVGTIVHVSIWIQASGGPNNSSSLLITLPFTTYSNSGYRGGITASFNSADFDNGFTEGRNRTHIDANVSYMQASFPFNDNGNWSSTGLTNAGVYDGFSVQASGTYISNA